MAKISGHSTSAATREPKNPLRTLLEMQVSHLFWSNNGDDFYRDTPIKLSTDDISLVIEGLAELDSNDQDLLEVCIQLLLDLEVETKTESSPSAHIRILEAVCAMLETDKTCNERMLSVLCS